MDSIFAHVKTTTKNLAERGKREITVLQLIMSKFSQQIFSRNFKDLEIFLKKS